MQLFRYTSLFVFPLALLACQPNSAPASAPEENQGLKVEAIAKDLLGTWETTEVEVTYHSYENRDTSFQQIIREADWQQVFGVRPARTEFTADGKHRRTHTLNDGQIADVTNGLWKVQSADSLYIIEPNKTLYYAHELVGERLVLTGLVDYDYDGKADDEYRSVMRLVSRTK